MDYTRPMKVCCCIWHQDVRSRKLLGHGEPGAYPRAHRAQGGVHHGQGASPSQVNAWSDVIVVKEGADVTLRCSEELHVIPRQVKCMMMPAEGTPWTMLFSVNISRGKADREKIIHHQAGRILEISDHVFLRFTATMHSVGRYSCLLNKGDRTFNERIVLLAIIKLSLAPATVIPIDSTARLKAEVSPSYAVAGGTWLSRTGSPLLTDMSSAGTLLTKLPRFTSRDSGTYTCNITVDGRSGKPVYSYTLSVTVSDKDVAQFPNITYGPLYSLAALSLSAVTLPCADISGDYVLLYWWPPDSPDAKPKLIFQFDRWRDSRTQSDFFVELHNHSSVLSGNFSFLLRPELKDAGRYQCEVFRDDQVFAQITVLTVLNGYSTRSSSSIELNCAYAERSQINSVKWSHIQRPKLRLPASAVLGRMIISIDLPLTPVTAGQYACTLKLNNGQTIRYLYTALMPSTEPPCCVSELPHELTTVSLLQPTDGYSPPELSVLLQSLSLLLFLVPVVAVAVGVLLWRRGPCTFPQNVERTLSHYSGEVENIYENPEDLRQSPPQNAVYMDLKLTGETDVYRELDRYDQSCG
ncbi:g6f-like isoform X1 [Ictalurus punctatus]|uniref:G6f-like isoform X1 n=1 Tax=Ictalurus punctatus TaxID=7998 RepID=A0A2D0SBV5_ICTPU|nr:g6f-like isoform X1 [Ictalurus punctatus]XP_053536576.1 g6f-like isoform X1 [Ictalurus punctatus]